MNDTAIKIMEEEPRDRFEIVVALLAVVTTLVAAWVGFLYANSSNVGDRASSRAQQMSLKAASARAGAQEQLEQGLQLLVLRLEQQARVSHAMERALFESGADRRSARLEQRLWTGLSEDTSQDVLVGDRLRDLMKGKGGPDEDPFFPRRMRAESQRSTLTFLARRDAQNEKASSAGARGGSYAAILTLLTVALYLFGFALTPQGSGVRGLFAFVGVVFLVVAVVFGPAQTLSFEPAPSRKSAAAYADGVIKALKDQPADAEYQLGQAISSNPTFANAYVQRADARLTASGPQFVRNASLAASNARRDAINDFRMARALGLGTPRLLTNLGFALIALGIEQDDRKVLDEGLEVTREVTQDDSFEPFDDPKALEDLRNDGCRLRGEAAQQAARLSTTLLIARYNLGAALIATGDSTEARSEYETAICLTLARVQPEARGDLLSGALTDLELVARHRPLELRDDILALKELVVGSLERGRIGPPRSSARISGLSVFVEAGFAQFTVARAKALAKRDEISAHWYFRPPEAEKERGFGWSELPQLSGKTSLTEGPEGFFAFRNYVGVTRQRCLADGRYRLELYDDGRLVGQAETDYRPAQDFAAFHDRASATVGCRPKQWARTEVRGGFMRGFVLREDEEIRGSRGLYLARLDHAPAGIDQLGFRHELIERVLRELPRQFPSPRHSGWQDASFAELGSYWHNFTYDGGRILGGAARDADGSVLVAFVFGPRGFFVPGDPAEVRPEAIAGVAAPQEIISSLSVLQPTAAAPRIEQDDSAGSASRASTGEG